MAGVIDPEGFTIPRRRACSTRQAIFEVAQLRAARATWAGRTSSVSVNLLRPRGKNPEIRVESMSCVVIIHQKDILFPGGTDSSWRCARRYRRTTHLDGPMPAPQRRHQGRIGSRTLSPQQHSSSKSAHPDYCTKMRVAACSGVGNRVVWSAPARPKRTWSCPSCEF
jgi:hypothetical protein